ncbi:unnamed protein product [Chilo suppressalis]|uniref:Glyceraldehyde 3-phosphate dehydrogenase NAD(P) binding domain-containing protein n=1 Tax=Chilo suppressalis TaxID=168631 RepID=A0ABN8L5X1_CHISP|nr:unnamed protein product [Chilo suppressalis]
MLFFLPRMIYLGINGFGRIGRVILRACLQKPDFEITAINDPAIDVQYICYLIKYDSTHGKFNGSVSHNKDEIIVNDKRIKIFHEKLPANIPWHAAGVHYVVESSGMFTTMEKASGHLANESVRRVIVTAPSVDVFMLILGVNDDKLHTGQKVISCASSTMYCLAPIVKVLEDSFGVADGFVTSIHAMTPSLKPLDGLCLRGKVKHWRDHRSIHQNIIPAMTGACKALGKIIPKAKDKLCGLAFRVPIVNVSVLDITIRLNSNTTLQQIIQKVDKASNTELKGIIRISADNAVSSDFIGETHSCILDANSSLQLKANFFKLVCWYENEYSYACRVIDTIIFADNKFSYANTISNISNTEDNAQQTVFCHDESCLKRKDRQFVLKKPISSQLCSNTQPLVNKDAKNENELYKIWKDEKSTSKPGLRQNENCFFHSCIAITPRNIEQMDSMKAQDRLELLKKEFSKMVNVTESLLKKSYVGSVHSKSDDKAIKHDYENNIELGKSCDVLSDKNKIIEKNKMYGDYKFCISALKERISSKEEDCIKCHEVSNTNVQSDPNTVEDLNPKNVLLENYLRSNEKKDTTKAQTIDPIDSAKGSNLETTEVHTVQVQTSTVNKIEGELSKAKCDNKNTKSKITDKEVRSFVKTNSSVQISKKLISEMNNTCKLYKNVKNSESKLRLTIKRDINELKYTDKRVADRSFNTTVNINMHDSQSLAHNEEYLNKPLPKTNGISPERYSIISDRTSKCGSPDSRKKITSNQSQ